jgi:hypothetical protein
MVVKRLCAPLSPPTLHKPAHYTMGCGIDASIASTSSIASLDYGDLNVTLNYRITVAYLTNLAIRIIFWPVFLPIFSSQILNPTELVIRTLRNAEHTESIGRTVSTTRSTTTAH